MSNRVVVTGLGAVSPIGNTAPATWDSMVAGKSGARTVAAFDPEPFSIRIAAEVKDFQPPAKVDAKTIRRLDRNVQFAVTAALEAVDDACLVIDESNRDDIGIIVGSAIGGIKTLIDAQKLFDERGPSRVSTQFIQNLLPDTASAQVAITTGARGPNACIVSACATGTSCLGEAAEWIRRGDAHTVIAGGVEATIIPLILAGFIQMRVLAQGNGDPAGACKPFDLNRSGFVMGEGSVMMVLEDADRAKARGARIYAELVSYGSSSDAFHLAAPVEDGEGSARAMKLAIRKSGMQPSEIQYINPHGTGTQVGDKFETQAFKTVFGDHADKLAISSTKPVTGHMMGAAGAAGSLAAVMAIKEGIIPPTINYETPDPDCDLDYVPNVARKADVRVSLANAIGLGGHNSCAIFRRYEE